MARSKKKLFRNGDKVILESGLVGFPGPGDTEDSEMGDIVKQGFRKLKADLDPHDRERNPVGGLREQSGMPSDEVDEDGDRGDDWASTRNKRVR